MIRLEGLHQRYGDRAVLNGVDLTVQQGEVVAICGPSGAGKSTLLRTINYLQPVDGGEIEIDGCRLPPRNRNDLRAVRQRVGMVFQQFNLYPHMTAAENICLAPTKVLAWSRKMALDKAQDLLEQVGLRDRAGAYPSQLSGGEQQRVAIARALAMQPKVLLLDEPTASLDMERKAEVLEVIKGLARGQQTVVLVSHELQFASSVANRMVFMDNGRIVESDIPETLLNNPREMRTQAFMRQLHL
ncbi:MAG TPA: amino acid ABC transporter ATP-binding protein [Gammaproteobacteria bacterium]|nr:amino acid ABC transporter ATP-binding protein [Gammaproteobacteria bacterium]